MRTAIHERDFESFAPPPPSSGLQWPGAAPEQLHFMRRVYEAHVARSASRRKFVGDVPASELGVVDGVPLRKAAADDCRAMLTAARADLAARKAAGDARAKGVQSVGITSGYRSATHQFQLWQKYFPGYYKETEKKRAAAPGGPHGNAAVALMVKHVGARIAAPGYSLHNEGRAVDLNSSERPGKPWRQTWFWDWLVRRAAGFSFFQNTSIDEPWHWEHRPQRLEGSVAAAPLAAVSPFARRLAAIAQQQYDAYHTMTEQSPALAKQIERYWRDLGLAFPGVGTPWSAVFVSWCVRQAGATSAEFRFATMHSVFIHAAIRNAVNQTGVFRAYPVAHRAPQIGDIVQNNRGSGKFTYDHAAKNQYYPSHSAIVVERGTDAKGGYIVTVGGNESNSVRRKPVRLDANGRISNPTGAYICVIQNLK